MNENKTYRTLDGELLDVSNIKDAGAIIEEINRFHSDFMEDVDRLTESDLDKVWTSFYEPEIMRLESYLYPWRNLNDLRIEEGCNSPFWETVYHAVGMRFDPGKLPRDNYWLEYVAVNVDGKEPTLITSVWPIDRTGEDITSFADRRHKIWVVKREILKVLRKAAV